LTEQNYSKTANKYNTNRKNKTDFSQELLFYIGGLL